MLDKDTVRRVKEAGARKVLVQVPEGLKANALGFTRQLEESGIEAVIAADPCYGSCDAADQTAKQLGCDLLLHVGHSDFGLDTQVPVIYDEYRSAADPVPLLDANMGKLKGYARICLVTTVQHAGALDGARRFLESQGKTVLVGQPARARHPGQILGCDHSAALPFEGEADCFLFIGTGLFHPLGLAMKTGKPVLSLDFEKGTISGMSVEKDRKTRIRAAHLAKAQDCSVFGILVSSKPGQMNMKAAGQAKAMLERKGKTAHVIVMDEISPQKLLGMKLDCLVNCACPRLTDDSGMFRKPVLNPQDVERL